MNNKHEGSSFRDAIDKRLAAEKAVKPTRKGKVAEHDHKILRQALEKNGYCTDRQDQSANELRADYWRARYAAQAAKEPPRAKPSSMFQRKE